MDEATAALDPVSQDQLMRLVLERLPDATIVSVGHRAELEAFHTRKLVLEYHPEGARLVGDEALPRTFGRSARFLSKLRPARNHGRREMPPAKVIYNLRAEARVGLGKDRRGKRTTVSGAVNESLAGEMRKLVSLTTDLHVASSCSAMGHSARPLLPFCFYPDTLKDTAVTRKRLFLAPAPL